MLKKFLSVLLAVMMIVSAIAVGVVSTNAATTSGFTPDNTKLYFDIEGAVDASGTPWSEIMDLAKDKVAFYLAGGDFDTEANATKPKAWGAKALQGTKTAGETGIFEFNPTAKGYTLTAGVQYKVIFVRCEGANWKDQTCSLFFTSDCLGHVAKCDGTMMENDVDSSKKSLAVYWDDSIDPTENGPVLCVTSIGNVVGSCVEQGKTKETLFVEFISEAKDDFNGKTGLENARYYTVEQAKTKTEQEMIDYIGEALGLTKSQVAGAFTSTDVETAWKVEDSTIPDGIRGDANSDKTFDSVDCTTIQKVLVQRAVDVYDEEAADADKDKIVDILDVSLMQRVLANITTFDKWDARHPRA